MRHRHRVRGLTLVELLIGMAVGLVVVAAGSTVVLDNVRENRALGLEMRLMADLRTAADIVSRDAIENGVVDGNEQFGFRLHNGAIELQLGDANWQAITDATVLTVTGFTVVPGIEETSLAAFCVDPCPPGSTACPPRQQVKRFDIAVAARSVVDARVQRSLRTSVRLRRLGLVGSCTG